MCPKLLLFRLFLMNHITHWSIVPSCCKVVFKLIKNYNVFFGQLIQNLGHKILVCYITLLAKSIHSNPLVGVFFNWLNLLLWNSLFNWNRDEAVCGGYFLISQSHATLQFPSGKSSLFAFVTNQNTILPTENLYCWSIKLNLHLILQSFCPGLHFTWVHLHTHSE